MPEDKLSSWILRVITMATFKRYPGIMKKKMTEVARFAFTGYSPNFLKVQLNGCDRVQFNNAFMTYCPYAGNTAHV